MRVRSSHGRSVVIISLAAGVIGPALAGIGTLGPGGRAPVWFGYGCLAAALGCALLLGYWLYAEEYRVAADAR